MPENAAPQVVHEALATLYDVALAQGVGDIDLAGPGAVVRATEAYSTLVQFIADAQWPPPAGVEPERLIAAGRLLLHSGDITPMGVIVLERIAQEVQ